MTGWTPTQWSETACELAKSMFENFFSADALKLFAAMRMDDRTLIKLSKKDCVSLLIDKKMPLGLRTSLSPSCTYEVLSEGQWVLLALVPR